jgi:hypothetical protein
MNDDELDRRFEHAIRGLSEILEMAATLRDADALDEENEGRLDDLLQVVKLLVAVAGEENEAVLDAYRALYEDG